MDVGFSCRTTDKTYTSGVNDNTVVYTMPDIKEPRVATTHYTYSAVLSKVPYYFQLHNGAIQPCEGRVPVSSLPKEIRDSLPLKKSEEEWWDDVKYYVEDYNNWSAKVELIVSEAQKLILDKAIERLERKKRCTAKPYGPGTLLGLNPCIACGEAGESGDCVNAVIEEAIKELNKLLGEV